VRNASQASCMDSLGRGPDPDGPAGEDGGGLISKYLVLIGSEVQGRFEETDAVEAETAHENVGNRSGSAQKELIVSDTMSGLRRGRRRAASPDTRVATSVIFARFGPDRT